MQHEHTCVATHTAQLRGNAGPTSEITNHLTLGQKEVAPTSSLFPWLRFLSWNYVFKPSELFLTVNQIETLHDTSD